jgi:hypothetical protein
MNFDQVLLRRVSLQGQLSKIPGGAPRQTVLVIKAGTRSGLIGWTVSCSLSATNLRDWPQTETHKTPFLFLPWAVFRCHSHAPAAPSCQSLECLYPSTRDHPRPPRILIPNFHVGEHTPPNTATTLQLYSGNGFKRFHSARLFPGAQICRRGRKHQHGEVWLQGYVLHSHPPTSAFHAHRGRYHPPPMPSE